MASPNELWVKFGRSTESVPIADCQYVSDFIEAVKQWYFSDFDAIGISHIRLHADLSAKALPSSAPLASLPPGMGTSDRPIIVKASQVERQTITPDEYLEYKPPAAVFSDVITNKRAKTTGSTSRPHAKNPEILADWPGFIEAARSFSLTDTSRIEPPVFQFCKVVDSERSLETVISVNVLYKLRALLRHCRSSLIFSDAILIKDGMKGRPDHVLHSSGTLMSFLEVKTVWDVPTPSDKESIVRWWRKEEPVPSRKETSIVNSIVQVYGYLAHNRLRYGMLTNGEVFWFFHRPNDPYAPTQLLVSPAISVTGNNPTLFRAMFYFISLVEAGHLSGISPTAGELPQDVARASSSDGGPYALPSGFDLSLYTTFLGYGSSGDVFEYCTNSGQALALKCCDMDNNEDGYEMAQKEIKAYHRLSPLQGVCIPKLHFYGECNRMFVIATTKIPGKATDPLPDEIVQEFKAKLAQYGVEHGDYRPENVLVDEDGKHWLIDFGMSTLTG